MSDNTYSSHNLRLVQLNDPRRKHISLDTLFLNLYDYWTEFHHPHGFVRSVAEKFHEKDKFFNSSEFFENYDNEKYFELLLDWKKNMKKTI